MTKTSQPRNPKAAKSFVVRDANCEDVPVLVDILRSDDLRGMAESGSSLSSYEIALREIAEGDYSRLLVAVVGEVIVGMVEVFAFRHFQNRGGLCCEIESVHVRSDFRRKGIGGALVAAAITQAEVWGCYRVQVTTDHRRSGAQAFYRALGFAASHSGFKYGLNGQVG